jgi:AraC-like DNA-binding protein
MRSSPGRWVPPGAWLADGYAEWQPPAALRGSVACLWAAVAPDDAGRVTLVLPDGCSDLIWERGVGAYVAGPDTGPVRVESGAGTVIAGVRFRPAAGGRVLGLPLSELRNQRVPLSDLLPAAARSLTAALTPAAATARLLDVTGRLVADSPADPVIDYAAARLGDPAARAEDIAERTGLSERQFRRRCHAAAGYGPKTLQRVLRFQRFVRLADAAAGSLDLAGAAVRAGYADQPHLTRECSALSGLTPAALARVRSGARLPVEWFRDHRGADLAEAQPGVDAGHRRVGRGQEHGPRAASQRVGGQRVGDRAAQTAAPAGRQHADPGDLRDVVGELVASSRQRAVGAGRGGEHRAAGPQPRPEQLDGSRVVIGGGLIAFGDGCFPDVHSRVPERDPGHGPRQDQVGILRGDNTNPDSLRHPRCRGERAEDQQRVGVHVQAGSRGGGRQVGGGPLDPLKRLGQQQLPLPGPYRADVADRGRGPAPQAGPGVVRESGSDRDEQHERAYQLGPGATSGHGVAEGIDAANDLVVTHNG